MSTANRIKEAMKIRGLRQADLVSLTGITKGAISSYLSGRYEPRRFQVHQLAKVLNVNELWLLEFEGAAMERLQFENQLAEEEIQLIYAYRKHQDLHPVIKKLLDIC